MDADGRRQELLALLCRKRHETVSALAAHFGVSARTILRDVAHLSLSVPLYTRSGRYHGGVYLMDGYFPDRLYLPQQDLQLLSAVLGRLEACTVSASADECRALRALIGRYTPPAIFDFYKKNQKNG